MRLVLALTAASLVIGVSAVQGAGLKYTCARGDTIRSVSVVSQPSAGRSCEVLYEKTSAGSKPEVLWHADSGTSFCADQANALATRLGQAGWTCAQGETGAIADGSPMPQPYSVPVEVSGAVSGDDAGVPASGVTAATRPAPSGVAPAFQLRPSLH